MIDHIAQDYIPVIASVGADREGHSHNVNADEAAGAVARAMRAYKVMFLTDVAGWLRDPADPSSVVSEAAAAEVVAALDGVAGGMRPKLAGVRRRACTAASRSRTSSTAACRTRCCSSCSPTPASARRSGRSEPRCNDATRATPCASTGARARGCGTTTGNEYLDFLCGISVSSVGHCHPAVVEAVREQAGRLMHVGNLFYTEPMERLAERLADLFGGGGGVFFTNSGAEAVEAALKLGAQGAGRAATSSRRRARSTGGPTAR